MTKTEIYQALALIEDVIIAAQVQLNNAEHMTRVLKEQVRQDVVNEELGVPR